MKKNRRGGPKTLFLVFLDNFKVSYFLYAGRCVKKILRICSKNPKFSPAAGWSYDFQVFCGYRNAPLPLVKLFTSWEDAIPNFSGTYEHLYYSQNHLLCQCKSWRFCGYRNAPVPFVKWFVVCVGRVFLVSTSVRTRFCHSQNEV